MSKDVSLLHPIYLDFPMMISFVAALEGGYAMENVQKIHSESSGKMSGQVSGEFGLSKILANFTTASVKGSGGLEGDLLKSREDQIILKHTDASVFMGLRDKLLYMKRLISLDECKKDEWDNIKLLDIVEISGSIRYSPVSEMIRICERMLSIAQLVQNGNISKATSEQRKIAAQNEINNKFMFTLIQELRADLDSSPVSDLILKNGGEWERCAVLDIPTKILPFAEQERLLCGQVVVIGKVTRVLSPGESINLYRRSVLGYAAQEMIAKMVSGFNDIDGMSVQLEPPMVEYPAIEIVPMAIYV